MKPSPAFSHLALPFAGRLNGASLTSPHPITHISHLPRDKNKDGNRSQDDKKQKPPDGQKRGEEMNKIFHIFGHGHCDRDEGVQRMGFRPETLGSSKFSSRRWWWMLLNQYWDVPLSHVCAPSRANTPNLAFASLTNHRFPDERCHDSQRAGEPLVLPRGMSNRDSTTSDIVLLFLTFLFFSFICFSFLFSHARAGSVLSLIKSHSLFFAPGTDDSALQLHLVCDIADGSHMG
jgi:hypothetical protein